MLSAINWVDKHAQWTNKHGDAYMQNIYVYKDEVLNFSRFFKSRKLRLINYFLDEADLMTFSKISFTKNRNKSKKTCKISLEYDSTKIIPTTWARIVERLVGLAGPGPRVHTHCHLCLCPINYFFSQFLCIVNVKKKK